MAGSAAGDASPARLEAIQIGERPPGAVGRTRGAYPQPHKEDQEHGHQEPEDHSFRGHLPVCLSICPENRTQICLIHLIRVFSRAVAPCTA